MTLSRAFGFLKELVQWAVGIIAILTMMTPYIIIYVIGPMMILHLLFLPVQLTVGTWTSEALHEWGQESELKHDIVMAIDLMDFMTNAGGAIGASHNYFGWWYSKKAEESDRSFLQKLLFWPNPWYVTEPPDEWPYPPLYGRGNEDAETPRPFSFKAPSNIKQPWPAFSRRNLQQPQRRH